MMNCAVLLRAFSLPNQSKAFRRNTVFFLLPPFSTRRAKMVGFPYTHKSRGFERKHGAAAYRWEELTKAPVSPSMLLNPRRYGDGAKGLWTTLHCVQENIIRGGQRDRSRRRPTGLASIMRWAPTSLSSRATRTLRRRFCSRKG